MLPDPSLPDSGDDFEDFDQGDYSSEEESESGRNIPREPAPSKTASGKLLQDDAEIAELERKLGMKGRKSLPKSFHDDGLDDVLGDLAEPAEAALESKKRKAEADEWLAEKRRKAARIRITGNKAGARESQTTDYLHLGGVDPRDGDDGPSGSSDVSESDLDGFSAADEDEEFAGFELDVGGHHETPQKRARENPYVAPSTSASAAKYVPPSRRKELGSDAELTLRLRKQLQGLVNRITDSNMISIVGEIEKIYREQPRQHVTRVLADLILVQVSDPTSLPDTLLILSAGFSTAIFKVIGMDFGAQLVEEAVARFDQHYRQATSIPGEATKEVANLITFLAELYNFQLIGCNLIFDYVRFLLEDLSELNAELLLRTIRLSGHSLRQDDPSSLKDIVALIRPAVTKAGEGNISVRTKFMIDTINDLKNNKMKAGASASAVISEHMVRMKKLLGSLNTRKLKATEPLRIGLGDIRNSEKKGKWWLVGASWAGESSGGKSAGGGEKKVQDRSHNGEDGDDDDDDDDDDESDEGILLDGGVGSIPDLVELAREQMMNTDVRKSIFVAILSASDYQDAYLRVLKLRLNKDRQREIPNVVIQCTGAEQEYNPYYTLIAKKLCADRKIRWSFQDALWKLFRRLGEPIFEDEAEEVNEEESIEMRRLVNIAKMYGTLIQQGALSVGMLKCLNFPYLQSKARAFVEVLLITAILGCTNPGEAEENGVETAIGKLFGPSLQDTPELCRSLQWFIKKVVRKSDLARGMGAAKKLKGACAMADRALAIVQMSGTASN